jgi:hypothetical protein
MRSEARDRYIGNVFGVNRNLSRQGEDFMVQGGVMVREIRSLNVYIGIHLVCMCTVVSFINR